LLHQSEAVLFKSVRTGNNKVGEAKDAEDTNLIDEELSQKELNDFVVALRGQIKTLAEEISTLRNLQHNTAAH